MTSNGDDIHQILQDLGIIVAILIGAGTAIFALVRKLRQKKNELIEKGKEIQARDDDLKDLKNRITQIKEELQLVQKRVEENEDSIHCVKDDIEKAVGNVRESLARLEGAISKLPNNKKK